MSKRAKILGVVLGAVLALTAIAAASASAALPEYVPNSGTFPIKFTSTSGKGTLQTTTGETVTCTSDSNVGELTGPKSGTVTVTFNGCTTTFFGFPISCKTAGKASGEIVTSKLNSELVYAVGKTQVLNLLSSPTGTEAEFECAGNTVKVTGSVLGLFPTINKQLHSTSLVLNQTSGKQEFEEYVNASGTTVTGVFLNSSKNGGAAVMSAEGTTDTITLEGTREVEIKG